MALPRIPACVRNARFAATFCVQPCSSKYSHSPSLCENVSLRTLLACACSTKNHYKTCKLSKTCPLWCHMLQLLCVESVLNVGAAVIGIVQVPLLFFFVFCSFAWLGWWRACRGRKFLLLFLCIWLSNIFCLLASPSSSHFFSYMNYTPPRGQYKYLRARFLFILVWGFILNFSKGFLSTVYRQRKGATKKIAPPVTKIARLILGSTWRIVFFFALLLRHVEPFWIFPWPRSAPGWRRSGLLSVDTSQLEQCCCCCSYTGLLLRWRVLVVLGVIVVVAAAVVVALQVFSLVAVFAATIALTTHLLESWSVVMIWKGTVPESCQKKPDQKNKRPPPHCKGFFSTS